MKESFLFEVLIDRHLNVIKEYRPKQLLIIVKIESKKQARTRMYIIPQIQGPA